MDLNADIIYRGFKLNDSTVADRITPASTIGGGISGCVVDSVDLADVDVVQFLEKRSLSDGMDAGDVYLGGRRIRMAGTLYATTRPLMYDLLQQFNAAMSPTLAFRDEPADKGYQPLYFSAPTNRLADYPTGKIDMRVLALPRVPDYIVQRDNLGGEDADALAIPWQGTFILRDPRKQSAANVDTNLTLPTEVSCTVAATNEAVQSTAHGMIAGDRVFFSALVGGTGLALNIGYYVVNVTTNTFKCSLTAGGSPENVTVDYTAGTKYVKIVSQVGNFVSRGDYHSPFNALIVVGAQAGSIVMALGGTTFTITVPASTGDRIIRYKGDDKVLTVEENGIEDLRLNLLSLDAQATHPLITGGTSAYTVTTTGCVLKTGSHMWFWESFA